MRALSAIWRFQDGDGIGIGISLINEVAGGEFDFMDLAMFQEGDNSNTKIILTYFDQQGNAKKTSSFLLFGEGFAAGKKVRIDWTTTGGVQKAVVEIKGAFGIFFDEFEVDPSLFSQVVGIPAAKLHSGIRSGKFRLLGRTATPGMDPLLKVNEFTATTTHVPEPSAALLLGFALVGWAGLARLNRRNG